MTGARRRVSPCACPRTAASGWVPVPVQVPAAGAPVRAPGLQLGAGRVPQHCRSPGPAAGRGSLRLGAVSGSGGRAPSPLRGPLRAGGPPPPPGSGPRRRGGGSAARLPGAAAVTAGGGQAGAGGGGPGRVPASSGTKGTLSRHLSPPPTQNFSLRLGRPPRRRGRVPPHSRPRSGGATHARAEAAAAARG